VSGVSGIDLNLLTALGALLEERNLTRAGARLSLSQPTMSGALARLRRHYKDDLLVRSGREYVLTAVAQRLVPDVREALSQVERTFGAVPAEFDPATSRRQFSVAISGQSIVVLSKLLQRVHLEAPRAQLDLRPLTVDALDGERGLLQHDLLIGPRGVLAEGQPEEIFRDRFVYVADPGNPRLRDGRMSRADLAALPHAVARRSHPESDAVARALASLGVIPRVTTTTPGWLPLPFVVAGTNLIAAVPERLARRLSSVAGVAVIEPPFGTIELVEAVWWHPMRAMDPALSWLRGLIRDSVGELGAPGEGGGEGSRRARGWSRDSVGEWGEPAA
jgi:DNA-binding transcriptional LysR family regulator